jgi:hypothetical protein
MDKRFLSGEGHKRMSSEGIRVGHLRDGTAADVDVVYINIVT